VAALNGFSTANPALPCEFGQHWMTSRKRGAAVHERSAVYRGETSWPHHRAHPLVRAAEHRAPVRLAPRHGSRAGRCGWFRVGALSSHGDRRPRRVVRSPLQSIPPPGASRPLAVPRAATALHLAGRARPLDRASTCHRGRRCTRGERQHWCPHAWRDRQRSL
jgi:hypothetical protein